MKAIVVFSMAPAWALIAGMTAFNTGLEKKPLLANVYLITPAKNPADQLDIFDARQLIQPHYKKEEFLILGIASGYEEALQLIEQITGECLDARGDCNLREYLLC